MSPRFLSLYLALPLSCYLYLSLFNLPFRKATVSTYLSLSLSISLYFFVYISLKSIIPLLFFPCQSLSRILFLWLSFSILLFFSFFLFLSLIYLYHSCSPYSWYYFVKCVMHTISPRSIYPSYIVTYYIKWVTTSWTYN